MKGLAQSLNLWLTGGGTNILKLILALILGTIVLSAIFCFMDVYYHDYPLSIKSYNTVSEFISQFINNTPKCLNLFLGIGFSSFKSPSLSANYIITFCGLLGLLWYSLIIQVFLRRIYK